MEQTAKDDSSASLPREPADLPAVAPPTTSFFVQLFLLPALIVFGIMCVWFLFGKLAGGDRTPDEYVEIICSTRGDRWKAAHDLSQLLRNGSNHTKDEALAARLTGELQKALDAQDGVEQKKLAEFLCGALGSFQTPTGVPMLRRAALPTFDAGVRRAGAIAIMNLAERLDGKLDDPNVVPELVALLRDDNEELRGLAALTLGFVGSEGARRGLTAAVNDPSPRVRFDAANALARLGDPAALPVLAEMLDLEGLKQRFALPDDRAGQPYDRELVNASLLTAMHSVAKLHAAKQPISMPVQNALAKLAESTDSAIRSEALNVQRKIAQ